MASELKGMKILALLDDFGYIWEGENMPPLLPCTPPSSYICLWNKCTTYIEELWPIMFLNLI